MRDTFLKVSLETFFQESSPKRVPYKSKFEGWLNSYIEKFDKYLENRRNIRYNNIWLNHIWKGVTVLADKLNDSFTTLAGDARVEFEEKKSQLTTCPQCGLKFEPKKQL